MDGYKLMSQVVKELDPQRIDEGTARSLKFMLKHPTFQSFRSVIEDKIIEHGKYLEKLAEEKSRALALELEAEMKKIKDKDKAGS